MAYFCRSRCLCSRNITGSSQRNAVRSRPAASLARDGMMTMSPGMWVKIDSPHWECQMPPPVR